VALKDELFYRQYPTDNETERQTLAMLCVMLDRGHEAFGQLKPRDFYMGADAFHGWFFGVLRSARQIRSDRIRYLLSGKHRRIARHLGVHSLPAEIASLFPSRGRVTELAVYVERLKTVRQARRDIWLAEQAYQRVWRQWDDAEHERRL
jgi:hypothetical protein